MASPDSSRYSRDETVAALTSFYRTLVKLPYVDPDALRLAPDGGWTDVNAEELRRRGKTDKVIDLLRHLPYLETTEPHECWTIQDGCICIEYHKGACYKDYPDQIQNLPGHVVPIGDMADRNGSHLLLDTNTGCVTDFEILEGNLSDYDRYEALPEHEKWMAFPTLPVREFFDRRSRLYEKLIWMLALDPLPSTPNAARFLSRADTASEEDKLLDSDQDNGGDGMEDEETAEVFSIYKRNGWPTDFNRDVCKSEIKAFLEAQLDESDGDNED